jgi:DNA-binding XRE family transcriptional regulator
LYYYTTIESGINEVIIENNTIKWRESAPELLIRLRTGRKLTRGQVARRLKISTTVLYNIETNRSRIKLDLFFSILDICGLDARAILRRHLFSVQELPSLNPAELTAGFRARLNMSQKSIAAHLGYKSGSIFHHFEKGLRIPDLTDYLGLMILAGDNVRGLIQELTGDKEFAEKFPGGTEATPLDWHIYWEHFYIPAIRHVMRTASYRSMQRYNPGYFSDILGITYKQERHALSILSSLQLINWVNAKPVIDEEQRIVIPKDIPREKLDGFKFQWLDFSKEHYKKHDTTSALMTLDLLPVSTTMYADIRKKIRRLQDEIHNMEQTATSGIAYIGWLSNYISLDE